MPVPTGQEVFESVRDLAGQHLDRFVKATRNKVNQTQLVNQENARVVQNVQWVEGTLAPLVNAYQQAATGGGGAQNKSDACLRTLDAIEQAIYQWETAHPATWGDDETYAAYMREPLWDLLSALQTDHKALVANVVTNNLTLWTPDRGTMGGGERTTFDQRWTALVTPTNGDAVNGPWGTGNLRISKTSMRGVKGVEAFAAETVANFQTEIFAHYAKMLTRANGRALIQTIQAGGQQVLTRPRHSACMGQPYVQAGIHDVDPDNTDDNLLKQTYATEKTNSANNTGVDCTICYDAGIPDGLWSHRDFNGQQIPSPAFVMFAHEMTHATHYQAGTSALSAVVMVSPDLNCNSPEMFLAFWQNREEYNTITGGENLVRNEHGLLPRTQFFGGLPMRFWTL